MTDPKRMTAERLQEIADDDYAAGYREIISELCFAVQSEKVETQALRDLITEALHTFIDPMFAVPNVKDVLDWCEKARKQLATAQSES